MIVSGDFFDVFDISDEKAGLFICDVMGHGVRAALVARLCALSLPNCVPYGQGPVNF